MRSINSSNSDLVIQKHCIFISAALLAENRLDQKKMDEFAQRAAMRKPE